MGLDLSSRYHRWQKKEPFAGSGDLWEGNDHVTDPCTMLALFARSGYATWLCQIWLPHGYATWLCQVWLPHGTSSLPTSVGHPAQSCATLCNPLCNPGLHDRHLSVAMMILTSGPAFASLRSRWALSSQEDSPGNSCQRWLDTFKDDRVGRLAWRQVFSAGRDWMEG